jgi:hypothetical protein
MFTLDPQERYYLAKQHQHELHAEGASARTSCKTEVNGRRYTGLQVQLGSLLILVGRTLRDDEPACPEIKHSLAGTVR